MTVKIKLCGFKKIEDISFALSNGIDYIGLNNIAISKRFLNADEILSLVENLPLSKRSSIVVLINHLDLIFIEKLRALGVEFIQSYLNSKDDLELNELGLKIIKVFSVASKADFQEIFNAKLNLYSYLLIDTKVDGSLGGTGLSFDWNLFRDLQSQINLELILAGGLKSENILEALEISNASFIDLAGGIEEKSGQKSYSLIKELIRLVRAR
jgi:phosphoribosylanthranilate isomerase